MPAPIHTVRAAQQGDLEAYSALVTRYARVAMAVALAHTGRPQVAEEVAQEAFLDAWRQLPTLREPAAFGRWLRRVVVKHADRVTRRRRRDTVAFDDVAAPRSGDDPEREAAAAEGRRVVHTAIAALPPHQREVVALFYLSSRSHAEIAQLLEVSVPAVKKRLHDARKRLTPTLEAAMTEATPSTLAMKVSAFIAARAGRTDVLSRALDADPSLVDARATLDPEELVARYAPPGRGTTLLHEAVLHGRTEAVGLLLDRGADLEATTPGGLTPVLLATLLDHPKVVRLLLSRGAEASRPMWHGGTGLHVAARRGRDELTTLLTAHGADPGRTDLFGRTPAAWAALHGTPRGRPEPRGRVVDAAGRGLDGGPPLAIPDRGAHPADSRVRPTGIKAIDLLAPLRARGVHRLDAGAGVGKIVLIGELGHALGPVVVAGLLDRTWDVRDFDAVLRELGVWDGAVVVLGAGPDDHAEVARTALALAEAAGSWVAADDRLADAMDRAGPGVPVVAFGPHVHPNPGEVPATAARIVLDPDRAARREFPAVSVAHSASTAAMGEHHARLANDIRAAVAAGGDRAERVLAWLTQPFRSAEDFNGRPGLRVSLDRTLHDAEALLAGAADDMEVSELRYIGALDTAGSWAPAPGGLF